jgi:hypothetical protein
MNSESVGAEEETSLNSLKMNSLESHTHWKSFFYVTQGGRANGAWRAAGGAPRRTTARARGACAIGEGFICAVLSSWPTH